MTRKRELTHRHAFEEGGTTYVRFMAEANKNNKIGWEAVAWLYEQEQKFAQEAAGRRDKREEETLALARMAEKRATRSLYLAAFSGIVAAISLLHHLLSC